MIGFAVVVGGEPVGPADRGVPYVFAGVFDQRPDVAEAFGIGIAHSPPQAT